MSSGASGPQNIDRASLSFMGASDKARWLNAGGLPTLAHTRPVHTVSKLLHLCSVPVSRVRCYDIVTITDSA